MAIVSTIPGKCKRCYSCVRNCPAKAIRVRFGQAEVIEERCIACGTCVRVCAQQAKQIESHVPLVNEFLKESPWVIAILAPSFPAAIHPHNPNKFITALRKLGFFKVMEVAFGAQLISSLEYPKIFSANGNEPIISTPCPAVVNYVERFHPSLVPNLAKVVSPMVAMGRAIKEKMFSNPKVVFIGPCIAKKDEIRDPEVEGTIDAVLTYDEIKNLIEKNQIKIEELEENSLDGPVPGLARLFPLSGGLMKSARLPFDLVEGDVIVTEGKERVIEILDQIEKGKVKAKFFDLLFCEGCINGPAMNTNLSYFEKRDFIVSFTRERLNEEKTLEDIERFSDVNLKRDFKAKPINIPYPSEEQIKEILGKIGKFKKEDELNCGVCGYSTCRDKAVAVFQGIAEIEMCLPYLIDELQKTQDTLIQAEKLSSIGQIVAGVAHEINNPLTGVLLYTKLMLKSIKEGKFDIESSKERLTLMEQETERCSRIIKNLLDFSRQTQPKPLPFPVEKTIKNAISILYHHAELNNVEIIVESETDIPAVFADPDQIQQVFINIILNAIQAMPNGGTLTIKIGYLKETMEVYIKFIDTGVGITKENLKKLFTPFFTTKEKGKGVGLGLAVCYGIIQRHKGKIEVESEVGKGTTFTIKLGAYYETS
ncbi:MAG: [Fe-Fe] hydrogenase large subunit C-terminal domain-containing protein [Candidatus Aminicenantia bacterium]